MKTRLPLLWSLLALHGCQCRMVVDEGIDSGLPDAAVVVPDAGAPLDAGVDAGAVDASVPVVDAGADPADGGCTSEVHCPVVGPSLLCANGGRQSCIDGHCVSDCASPARTCTTARGDPECITCTQEPTPTVCVDNRVSTCPAARCGQAMLTIERSTCPALPMGLMLQAATDPQTCLQSALRRDGSGEAFAFYGFGQGELVAHFANGTTCVSRSAVTGALRSLWACTDGCEFQLMGCE